MIDKSESLSLGKHRIVTKPRGTNPFPFLPLKASGLLGMPYTMDHLGFGTPLWVQIFQEYSGAYEHSLLFLLVSLAFNRQAISPVHEHSPKPSTHSTYESRNRMSPHHYKMTKNESKLDDWS